MTTGTRVPSLPSTYRVSPILGFAGLMLASHAPCSNPPARYGVYERGDCGWGTFPYISHHLPFSARRFGLLVTGNAANPQYRTRPQQRKCTPLRFRWSHACLFHARGRIGYRQFARYHSAAFLPHLVESNTSKEWNPGDLGRVHPRCPRTTIIPLRGQSASGKSPSLLLIPSPKFRLAEFGLCRGRFGLMCSIARFLLRLWLSNRHRGELCSRCS
jgi:hypothetical protein